MFSVMSVHQVVILCTGGSHVTITYDALDFTVQLSPPPSPDPGSPPSLDIGPHWPCSPSWLLWTWDLTGQELLALLVTSGGHHWDLFKPVHFRISSPPMLTSGGYCSTYCQYKRVVRILLECFLVIYSIVCLKCRNFLWTDMKWDSLLRLKSAFSNP